MKNRNLGSVGPELPLLGFGCMGLQSNYTETNDAQAAETVHRALDLGITHFDTADAYDAGQNEQLVGRILGPHRERCVIATKFGQLVEDGNRIVRGTPEYVKSACEASLTRLGIETIDLYYAHRIDPNVPVEETVGAMSELVDEGKVRWLGLSEASPETVRRGHTVHPIAAVQVEFSLWTRFAEDEHFDNCADLDIAFVSYAPLGRGFLGGNIKSAEDLREGDRRRAHPRFSAENIEKNLKKMEVLSDVAVEVGASPAQVALAWVLSCQPFMHAIPGTTNPAHLEENVAATDIQLSEEQMERLAQSFDVVAGERYPAGAMGKLQI